MAASSQQFCVKWNSYSTNLQSVFPRLLTSEHFVDVTLACEGQMIKCHKVVLSACSTYFERLLVSNPCPHPIIFMKDMKHFEVQALVDFMYRGEVNVSQDELNSLLVAAEALQIRGLCGSDNAVNGGEGGARMRGAGPPPSSPPPPPTRAGNESPRHHAAAKRRRSDGDSCPPRIVSVTSNGEEVGPATFRNAHGPAADADPAVDSGRQQHNIKQESLDGDDSYGNEHDGDALDEEFDRLEQQEDSDGLKEESSRTGQAGPSGLSQPTSRSDTDTPDKTATDLIEFMALQHVSCQLSLDAAQPGPMDFASASSLTPQDLSAAVRPSPTDGNYGASQFETLSKYSAGMGVGGASTHIRIRRSDTELKKAAECIHKGMTFQNVSDIFRIPISTIRFYMARNGILPQRRRGRNTSRAVGPAAFGPAAFVVTHQRLPDLAEVKKE